MLRLRLIAACLSAMLLLGACQSGPLKLVKRTEADKDAQELLDSIDGPEVPSFERALLQSAEDAEREGNYVRVTQYYTQLLDKSPDNSRYRLGYADALRKSGQYPAAISQYDRLKDKAEFKPDALEGIALAQMAQGEFEQAGDNLSEVMELDAARWQSINAIGILFTIRDMFPEAREYFAEALVLKPQSVAIRNNMALMEAMAKNYDEAQRLLKEAQGLASKHSPEQMQVDMNRALVYAIQGEVKQAEEAARPWLTEAQLLNNMGYYSHLADNDQMAESYLNMALTKSPKHYQKAWTNLDSLKELMEQSPAKKR